MVMELAALRNKAISLLARREHSAKELADKLKRYTFDEASIQKVLTDVQSQNLQNDTRFIESFVHWRRNQGYGPRYIKQELMRRGISKSLADNAVNEREQYWTDLAKKVRNKKFGNHTSSDFKIRSKQMRFLYQKGFTEEHVFTIFDE